MSAVKLAMVVDTYNTVVGDLYLGSSGKLRLTNSLSEEVAQYLYTCFRFFQTEWFLDRTQGVPWFQQILGQKTSTPIVLSILRQVVKACPGVKAVNSFALTNVGRAWTLDFAVTLINGAVLKSSDFAPLVIQGPT